MSRAAAVTVEGGKELLDAEAYTVSARGREKAREKQATREVARPAFAVAVARSVEERLGVLEATHATSADLRELRSEARLIRWVLSAVAGALIGVIGMVFSIQSSMNARVDAAVVELRTEIRATNDRLDKVIERMDARLERMDARIDKLDAKLDARFDALMAELRAQRRD
ncbi:hypothetical protein AXK11_07500 [Cephaloticoccus primus]|uniref:Uncharacterized protein n=1 Tax=Cephaloticoccus primus TaxID=1548207 RepID=A0A139SKC1_9BACT|nr:hypothetical protein [Cephaloticoccus primus]KXU35001.1 hypothetical protein AXK11_07500 [Cephaloticoccus primus]